MDKTYYDKNNMYNGRLLSEITLNKDMSVKSFSCGRDAGCTEYKGSFTISGTTLTIILNKYQDVDGSWNTLPEKAQETKKYTIIDDNIFSNDNAVYIIK